MGGLAMEPADSCSNSPPSPPPTSTPLWTSSPIRIRDSVSRPRRSLLSAHFSGEEGKVVKMESPSPADGLSKSAHAEAPLSAVGLSKSAHAESRLSADGLSKSLPSLPISAFLDKQEEEALEPTTPPHTATLIPPPMAPRKSSRQRVAPRGKHRPRRLLFGEGVSAASGDGEQGGPGCSSGSINGDLSPQQKTFNRSRRVINGALTPPQQSLNSSIISPDSASSPEARRIRMRDLR